MVRMLMGAGIALSTACGQPAYPDTEDAPMIPPRDARLLSNDAADARTAGGGDAGGSGGSESAGPYRSGSRIKTRVVVGEDGVRMLHGYYDSLRAEDCSFVTAGDGVLRCLPIVFASAVYEQGYFLDSTCTTAVAVVPVGTCTPKYTVTYATTVTCPPTLASGPVYGPIYPAEAVAPAPAQLFFRSDARCATVAIPGFVAYRRAGAAIPYSEFQAATIVVE